MEMKPKHIILFLLLNIASLIAQHTLEWVKEYRGDFAIQQARGIVADDSGNVYIGVTSFDTLYYYGMTLIKYSSEGELRWIRKYEGAQSYGKSNDKLQAITIDDNNNIYITGASEFLSTDKSRQSYVAFITIKYNPQGEEQWLAKYKIDSLGDGWYFPYTIAVDKNENVYVGGNFDKSILLKYDSKGELLWNKNIDSMETVNKIILDDSANIYIANSDLSILKYDTNGNLIWKGYGDELNGIEKIANIKFDFDENGNIYASGFYYPGVSNDIIISVKYNRYGNIQWAKQYGQEIKYYMQESTGVSIDSNGNFYVSGWFWNQNNFETKYLLIKYDSLGNEVFVSNYKAKQGTWLRILNTAIDSSDNIYIIGKETKLNAQFGDLTFVKFDTEGNVLNAEKYGELNRDEEASYIAFNKKNDIFILADSYSSKDHVVITLKYTKEPVNVKEEDNPLPSKPLLSQNYPNPFNPSTTITYTIPTSVTLHATSQQLVQLKIYDILGREVATLVNQAQKPGKYQIKFEAENLPSGVYYYQIKASKYTETKKMILIR